MFKSRKFPLLWDSVIRNNTFILSIFINIILENKISKWVLWCHYLILSQQNSSYFCNLFFEAKFQSSKTGLFISRNSKFYRALSHKQFWFELSYQCNIATFSVEWKSSFKPKYVHRSPKISQSIWEIKYIYLFKFVFYLTTFF